MKKFEGKNVLVVDDKQGYRDVYSFIMEPLGIHLECAQNGKEGVDKVREKPYDVIFMDVHMPVMDGYAALKEIKSLRPGQKIVIFSSSSDPEFIREKKALKEGAVECLYKPMDIEQVEKVLEKALEEEA